MEVIKNNNTITIECKRCKSILKITMNDIKSPEFSNYYVICAACHNLTDIDYDAIPKEWFSYIHRNDDL